MEDSLARNDELGREPRGARRKRETRSRLVQAALRLMAEKGMEGVAINDITEAADVGFGSFYNHFASKEAIYEAVVDSVFEDFADWIDRAEVGISDPAETISIAVRHVLLRAEREPLWGQFLIREGVSMRSLERGLGRRLFRDIRRGIEAQRFSSIDPFMSLMSAGGTVLLSVAAASTNVENPVLSRHDLPQRTAAAVLRILGLDPQEADEVARRRLPGLAQSQN